MPVLEDQSEVAQAEKTRIIKNRADYVRVNMDKPDRELAARYGLNVADIQEVAENTQTVCQTALEKVESNREDRENPTASSPE